MLTAKDTHSERETNSEQDRVHEHAAEADEKQGFPARFLDQHQRNDRHQDVHRADAHRGVLGGGLAQLGHREDFGGEKHHRVDAGQLLSEHDHDGDE